MQAVIIEEFGDPSGLRVVDTAAPSPAANQVLLRTEAVGVGGVDAMIRRGALGSTVAAGLIPGGEVAGVVTAVGEGVDRSWIGRRVWAATGTSGSYAEQAVAVVDDVTAIPDELSAVAAVALGSAATVAHFALAHAHLSPGETVLIRGGGGSIGIAAVELARREGAAAVAVTTSSPDRGRRLRELGANHVLDRVGDGDAAAPKTYDVVIDIVGGAAVPAFVERLRPNGRFVLVGAVAGFPPPDFAAVLLRDFQQSRSVATFSLASVPVEQRNEVRAAQFEAAVGGRLTPVVQETMPLARAADAHRSMDDGRVFGRIVLIPGDQR